MPLYRADIPAIIKAIRTLIHALENYLNPKAPVPASFPNKEKASPADNPARRYWMSQVLQAAEVVRGLLLPSWKGPEGSVRLHLILDNQERIGEFDPREDDPYCDITNSQLSPTQKAVLKGLAGYCRGPDLSGNTRTNPEQVILHLEEAIEKLGSGQPKQVEETNRKAGKPGRPRDTDPQADKRIYDAWNTRGYKTYQELADNLHLKKPVVATAIDRHRKRLERGRK
jgi:hypothetical protein